VNSRHGLGKHASGRYDSSAIAGKVESIDCTHAYGVHMSARFIFSAEILFYLIKK